MKKLVSILLTFAMLLALMPLTVFATTEGLVYTLSDDETYYIVSSYTGSATKVVIPSEYEGLPVKEIGGGVFSSNRDIESVEIPYSIIKIGTCAFYDCDGITKVTIPDSVTTMGYEAFGACDGMLDIYCTAKAQPEGWNKNWNAYTSATIHWGRGLKDGIIYVLSDDETYYIVWRYEGTETDVEIPSTYSGLPVKEIDEYAFYDCREIASIDIPNSVTTIGGFAFYYCSNLSDITIKSSITTIGDSAFGQCINLVGITIPDSVTTLGNEVFYECLNLMDINCEAESKPLGWHEYWDNYCNATVHWGVDVEDETENGIIYELSDDGTYYIVSGYEGYPVDVVIPSEYKGLPVKEVAELVFFGCNSLESVIIGDSVTTIGRDAFACESLKKVTFGKSVTTIGSSAFFGTALESVVLPSSVKTIGVTAFCWCERLKSVELSDSLTTIGDSAFSDCTSLTSIEIPDSVTTIGEYAFAWNTKLAKVKIGKSVKSIGNTAFYECGITEIVIPASVTTMGGNVFNRTLLTDIYCEAESKPFGWNNEWNIWCDATVHWGCKVKITAQPKNVSVQSGKIARVTVNATGEGLTYKWYFKNKGDSKFTLTNSYKSNTYSLEMNGTRASRQVYCVITDRFGNSVKTKTVTLGMAVKITKQPTTVSVQSGKQAKVTVSASGEGKTYKWYYKDKGASKFTLTNSFKGDSYYIEMNGTRAGRQVYCVITDKYGNSVKTNTVTLGMAVKITKQPTSVTVANGSTAKVTVSASGEGKTYQWYFKDKGLSKFYLTTSFKGATYSVTMTNARAGRQVYCVITDKYGNSVKTNTVTLNKN